MKQDWTSLVMSALLVGATALALILGAGGSEKAFAEPGKIYWTDKGTRKIQRANSDGSGVEDLVTIAGSDIRGVALDVLGGKMYWTDFDTNKVQRADLDGSNIEDLVTSTDGLVNPNGITLDLESGKIYWTDKGNWLEDNSKIQRSNLDGSGIETLLTTAEGLVAPEGIALDLVNGKIYWTESWLCCTIPGTGKVKRAGLGGSGVEELVTGLDEPTDIALDVAGGKMYWTDANTKKVQKANLNGTVVEDLITGLVDARGIALDLADGKMYWVGFYSTVRMIQRSNLNGTGIEELVTTGLTFPVAIALLLDVSPLEVSPLEYDYGDVALGTVSTVIVTISNVGDDELTLTGLAFQAGSSDQFSILSAPSLPLILPPVSEDSINGTVDVEIAFTPWELGYSTASLEVAYDGTEAGSTLVELGGVGVEAEFPSEVVEDLLIFFDSAVGNGSLEGDGPGRSAGGRLNALRNMIEAVGDLVDDGLIVEACQQLLDVYKRCDGNPRPPEFITGDAAQVLAGMTQGLRTTLGCE
jgi:sugar lactone lactonase YvrE